MLLRAERGKGRKDRHAMHKPTEFFPTATG
jgi:hypothetical protein